MWRDGIVSANVIQTGVTTDLWIFISLFINIHKSVNQSQIEVIWVTYHEHAGVNQNVHIELYFYERVCPELRVI